MQQRLAAVGEMAAGIAHEIRNPLASMSGSIQILRQELPLTDEQGQLMDIVIRESERLNETIRSFLAYARPQRQSMRHMDVAQVITDTAPLLQNSAERAEAHRIAVDVPAEPVQSRPTRRRFGRSSGTWRPTACARCRTAARCTLAVTPRDRRRAARGRSASPTRASASPGGDGRDLPAVSRQLRARAPGSGWRSCTGS